MPLSIAFRYRAMQTGPWFVLLVGLILCAEALGYAACVLAASMLPHISAWLAMLGVALVVGAVAAILLDWLVLDGYRRLRQESEDLQHHAAARQQLEIALASRIEQQRRLRHDIRGALSPVLLTADRLLNHADPMVKRSAEIMVRTVDRATTLLAEAAETANPPADP